MPQRSANPTETLSGSATETPGLNPATRESRATFDIFRAAIQMCPLPLVLTDPHQADCPLIYCNPAFYQLTGYDEAEVLGRNCRFLQGKLTDPASIDLLHRKVAAGATCQVEMWNYRRDGSAFWNAMFVAPVNDEQGRLLYYMGSQLDVTARREADEARERTQRMDTLGSMAAGLAHEFNNLMTVAVGNIEAVTMEPLSERQAERLGRADWAARAAGRLTQQMLSFAQRQSLDAETVDLNVIAAEFDRVLVQVAGAVPMSVALHGEALPARLDAGQLELALINLVRNAADACGPGGRIVLSTRVLQAEGAMAAVEIAVSDTGSGMSQAVAKRVTEPFFTTKAHGKGTGLGLSMVQGFAQQSGGRMQIDTVEGQGTTVRLIFPRSGVAEADQADVPKH